MTRATCSTSANMPAIWSRWASVPGATGRQLGRGAGDDHLAARPKRSAWAARSAAWRAGRRGDVVIWSGDPLELASAAEAVWIDGVRQPLDNRQTKLRDRYRDLERERAAGGVSAVTAAGHASRSPRWPSSARISCMSHPLRAPLVGAARRARLRGSSIRWSRWSPSAG